MTLKGYVSIFNVIRAMVVRAKFVFHALPFILQKKMIRTLKSYVDIFNVIRAIVLKEVCFSLYHLFIKK